MARLIALLLTAAWAGLAPAPGVRSVALEPGEASGGTVAVRLAPLGRPVGVVELLPHETTETADLTAFVWTGDGSEEVFRLSRASGAADRLYSRFLLVDRSTGRPVGHPRAVTDIPPSGAYRGGVHRPDTIKGITCPVDHDDVLALGNGWVDFGVMLNVVTAWWDPDPEEVWVVDGRPIGINMHYVRSLDADIKPLSDAGLRVILIPINAVPTEVQPANPTIHPRTDLARTPNHLGAFNLTDHEGYLHYRAAIEFLAHRYGDPEGEHGFVSDYVIGNEIQSHWYWHNMGESTPEELVRDYVPALRVAWLACQKANPDLRVYVSLDHNWNTRVDPNPLKAAEGREVLDRLNRAVRAEGPFPWDLAFHPYPEDMFDAATWDDETAVLGFDAPKVTFRNLEVLPAYLAQPQFLRSDAGGGAPVPPRIILSEQGFHCRDGTEGERIQAAAYAYAYQRCLAVPEIEAFILHRHADHPGDGGLRLGVWESDFESDRPSSPVRKRPIYEVFRAAGTPAWEEAFAFALEVIGVDSWAQVGRAAEVPAVSGEVAPRPDPDALVADLSALADRAEWGDTAGWRIEWTRAMEGLLWPTLFHHPPGQPGQRLSTATYALDLPRLAEGEALRLEFGTKVLHPDSDGVGFAVLADGRELWSGVTRPGDAARAVAVDLSPYAGQRVRLTLQVDSLGDPSGDWAHWVRPMVVRSPR